MPPAHEEEPRDASARYGVVERGNVQDPFLMRALRFTRRDALSSAASFGAGALVTAALVGAGGPVATPWPDSSRYLLLAAVAVISAGFAMAATLLKDDRGRTTASVAAGVAVMLFLVLGFVVASAPREARERLNADELLTLSTAAQEHGRTDLAIEYLQRAQPLVQKSQAKEIAARIDSLEAAPLARLR